MDSRDVGTVLCVAAALAAAWFGKWGVVGVAIPLWIVSLIAGD